MHPTDGVTRACLALLAVVAVIAGVLSYAGLYQFAVGAGQSIPVLWPLVLDLAAVIASLLAWQSRRAGGGAWMARSGVVALVVMSTALQVSIAPDNLAARVGHGLPPVVLVWLWELALSTARVRTPAQAVEQTAVPAVTDKPQVTAPVRADKKADTPAPRPVPSPRPNPVATPAPDPVLAAVRALTSAGDTVTAKSLAARLGCTDRTGRRHLNRPDVREILESSSVPLLDRASTLRDQGACDEDSGASPSLSAPTLAMSGASTGVRS